MVFRVHGSVPSQDVFSEPKKNPLFLPVMSLHFVDIKFFDHKQMWWHWEECIVFGVGKPVRGVFSSTGFGKDLIARRFTEVQDQWCCFQRRNIDKRRKKSAKSDPTRYMLSGTLKEKKQYNKAAYELSYRYENGLQVLFYDSCSPSFDRSLVLTALACSFSLGVYSSQLSVATLFSASRILVSCDSPKVRNINQWWPIWPKYILLRLLMVSLNCV